MGVFALLAHPVDADLSILGDMALGLMGTQMAAQLGIEEPATETVGDRPALVFDFVQNGLNMSRVVFLEGSDFIIATACILGAENTDRQMEPAKRVALTIAKAE